METEELVDDQFAILATHRRRLAKLRLQQARLGDFSPPYIALDIEEAVANIAQLKAALHAAGVAVDDQPEDVMEPLAPAGELLLLPLSSHRRYAVTMNAVLIGVTAFVGAVLINIATGVLPELWKPYLWLSWPLAVLVSACGIWLSLRQAKLTDGKAIPLRSNQRNRAAMLHKVRAIWVTGLLEQSLTDEVRITLNMEEKPDAVYLPLNVQVQELRHSPVSLPAGTPINAIFDHFGGELLILGAPGAGKTTLLLELARDLLNRANQESAPIPVVFNLSSWGRDRLPLVDWLAQELNTIYDVPRNVAQAWVEGDTLLLLLDGLDEMQVADRDACVEAINAFRSEHGAVDLAVCCRLADYENLHVKLKLLGAIRIQPLSDDQIDAYLDRLGERLINLRRVLAADPTLRELATAPLMLAVMTLVYQQRSSTAVGTADTGDEQEQLFAAYVKRMLGRRSKPPRQTSYWLAWLARTMIAHDQTVFLIERLQPSVLSSRLQYWCYTAGEGIGVALIAGIGTALVYGLRSLLSDYARQGPASDLLSLQRMTSLVANPRLGLLLGSLLWLALLLSVGLVIGLSSGLVAAVLALPTWNEWMARALHRPVLSRAIINFAHIGVAAGLGAGITSWLFAGSVAAAFEFATIGPVAGVAAVLAAEPGKIAVVETLGWSWRRMMRSSAAALLLALLWGLTTNATGGLLETIIYRPDERIVIYTLALGLAGGLTSGQIDTKARPNQGIRRSAKNALLVGAMTWLIVGVAGGAIDTTSTGLGLHIISGLEFGLAAGIVTGLGWGGFVCLQHAVLRLVLWLAGSIPRRYSHFLNYATDCLFLRRVGGGYIFIHRLLMVHFASIDQAHASDGGQQ